MAKGPAEIAHGPMLIGFIFNLILYGIMVTQVYLYYTTFQKDRTWMKLFVGVIFVADTLNTIFDSLYLYNTLIKHFSDVDNLMRADWVFATDPALTGIIASLVQLFFAWRILILTKSWILVTIVALAAVSGGVAGVIAAHFSVVVKDFTRFQSFKADVIVWLTAESIGDIMITTILVWYLVCGMILPRFSLSLWRREDIRPVSNVRIWWWTALYGTGLLTSIVAILDLVTYLTDTSGTHLMFNFPLCKLYTNSLMSSLNTRAGWKFGSGTENRVDSEKSGGPLHSHVHDVETAQSANWRGARSAPNSAIPPRKYNNDLFNSRGRVPGPEVHVHVESHELRDVPSARFNSSPSASLEDTYDMKEDSGSVNGRNKTIVISANMLDRGGPRRPNY